MREKVEELCQKLLPQGARILVACSGGADSLALLEILWHLSSRYSWQLAVGHYEHGIRGDDSLADAAFVADFCHQRHIPCFVEHGKAMETAKSRAQSLEQVARDLRYDFLERTCQAQGFGYIATAHHADDQAETVLMRILRGTGIKGLGAMRPQSGGRYPIVRPLLGISKAEILVYCQQQGLDFREDATNFVADCTRNRLRLDLLPQLRREYNPEISRSLCQLAEMAAETADFLQGEVDRCWQEDAYVRQADHALNQRAVADLHPALQRGLIRKLWEQVTGSVLDLNYQQTGLVRRLLLEGTTGSQQELSHHYMARLAYGYLTIGSSNSRTNQAEVVQPAADVQVPGITLWGPWKLTAEWQSEVRGETSPRELYLYPENFAGGLVLRTRKPGDYMRLPGGCKKLKKLMIDDKVPQAERDMLPLLANGSEIIWMIGRRRSANCLHGSEDYHRILYLKLEERGI
ncbi:tRNA(Ile)-lysidine synthase [Selenomonas ruminantium]|uniref:tRNA(Ile)-lysidine synthase n=1 Tax=Selenomonas ruminantium TaxID=971 RepID=A0A1M6R4A8_SELRU|nr:tRNA lysidine(34) synthetase TilS [Selenomonas ruminantium]SHK27282.1 tRNA(Ile)-lysidine synthase [Selenomonas ruminantium]